MKQQEPKRVQKIKQKKKHVLHKPVSRFPLWPSVPDPSVFAWVERYAVRAAPSRIAGAGPGVFARVPLPRNMDLGFFRGERLSKAQVDARWGTQCAPYTLQLGRSRTYVDAVDPRFRNWTALVNDARGSGSTPNCAFSAHGVLHTLRPVQTDDELLVDYGVEYWDE